MVNQEEVQANESSWATCSTTERDRINGRRAAFWMFVWMAAWLATLIVVKFEFLEKGAVASTVALLTVGLGVKAALAQRKLIAEADELVRKVQLDAYALAFAVGTVGGLTYWLLAKVGAIEEADVAMVVTVMLVVQSLSTVLGMRRYR